jgi:hypothetical protein
VLGSVQPVLESVQPVLESVQPVLESVQPVLGSVQPVLDSVTHAVEPVVGTVVDLPAPVVDAVAPMVETVADGSVVPARNVAPIDSPPPAASSGADEPAGRVTTPAPATADSTTPAHSTRATPTQPVGPLGSTETPATQLTGPNGRVATTAPAPTTLDASGPAAHPDGAASRWIDGRPHAGSWTTASADPGPSLIGPPGFDALPRLRDGSVAGPASSSAELPGLPGAPSGGGGLSAPGGASTALYALLLAFAALALLRFDRLQLRPVQWRCAAFVALLERPG